MLMVAEWAVYAGLAASCAFFITVFLHMVANAFNLTSLRMWVKAEYMQVLASFLIIALAGATEIGANQFGTVFPAVGSISSSVTMGTAMNTGNVALSEANAAQGAAGNPTAIGEAYLKTVIGCEQSLYSIIYTVNFYFEDASKLAFDVRGNEASASGFPLSGWVSLNHYINNNIVYLVLFHYVQYSLLQFAAYTMLPVFLPIGLALRAFPVTRGAGGLVTAIALGFAFVFPISYVLIVAMMPGVQGACTQLNVVPQNQNYQTLTGNRQMENLFNVSYPDFGSWDGKIESPDGKYQLAVPRSMWGDLQGGKQVAVGGYIIEKAGTQLMVYDFNPCLANEGAQIENYYRVKMSQDWLGQQLDYYSQLLGLLFMQALFYPLASLIITFTFIRQTGSLFGADLAEIGRGLIKII
jgi:hypothetical protein